jgi:hypothetical protein
VTAGRVAAATLLAVAIATGTALDRAQPRRVLVLDGYRVLAVDLHTHSSTWSDGGLTPWGLVLEAERQGLDAFAITGHNQLSDGRVGRWFARLVGGPLVFTGQEILNEEHHVIAVGIDRVIDFRKRVVEQIDDIHRQGGIAIAAHPVRAFWPAFDRAALATLDGSEVCHPLTYIDSVGAQDLADFAQRSPMAAIGSSDFHGLGRMGVCRTYVFARGAGEQAILDAIRAKRTVVYGRNGRVDGDSALIRLAESHPELRAAATGEVHVGWLDWLSRFSGVAGLLALFAATRRPH